MRVIRGLDKRGDVRNTTAVLSRMAYTQRIARDYGQQIAKRPSHTLIAQSLLLPFFTQCSAMLAVLPCLILLAARLLLLPTWSLRPSHALTSILGIPIAFGMSLSILERLFQLYWIDIQRTRQCCMWSRHWFAYAQAGWVGAFTLSYFYTHARYSHFVWYAAWIAAYHTVALGILAWGVQSYLHDSVEASQVRTTVTLDVYLIY